MTALLIFISILAIIYFFVWIYSGVDYYNSSPSDNKSEHDQWAEKYNARPYSHAKKLGSKQENNSATNAYTNINSIPPAPITKPKNLT